MSSAQATASPAGRDARLHRATRIAARVAEAGLVVIIAYLAASALWFVLYGDEARSMRLDVAAGEGAAADVARDLSALADFTVFDARATTEDAPQATAPETRLNLVLRGVRTGASPMDGSAVIESPGQGQRALAAGMEIVEGVRLIEIHPDRVLIDRRGARETIYLRDEARRAAQVASQRVPHPAAAPSGDAAGSTSGASALSGEPDVELAARLDVEDWVDGLRLEPVLQGGALQGLRVRDNTRLEVLRASGLLPGDVIRSVNGVRLTGAEAARAVSQAFETADQARLEIERDGAAATLTIPLSRDG